MPTNTLIHSKSMERRLKLQRQDKMQRLHADTIREDGRLERYCKHGIGHTVGHILDNRPELQENWFWVHGCDNCCSDWLTESSPEFSNPDSVSKPTEASLHE